MKHLLLLHGALGSEKSFNHVSPILKDHFIIHTIDFEGHGNFMSDADYSIELFTKNTLAYIHQSGIDTFSIFGYSMGGYVALNLANSHPGKIEKIVTYGTKFNWTPETSANETKMLVPEKVESKIPVFAQHLKKVQLPNDWKQVMRKTAKLMVQLGMKPLINDKLNSIETEVVIGISNSDKMVSIEESKIIVDQLKNGCLIELDNLPHPIDQIPPQLLVNFITSQL